MIKEKVRLLSSISRRAASKSFVLSSRWQTRKYCESHKGCEHGQRQTDRPSLLSSAVENVTIATKQQLYMIDPITPGSVFFLPHGAKIFNKLVSFMKHQQLKHGFQEVITPLIYKKSLWETSGHWENYKDDMFKVESTDVEKEEYGLKPMNCPGHCIVFKRFERSYNELPIRFSDFSSLHRNESSGSLSGLTRVRRFHQDDGHIFCRPDQIKKEIDSTLKLINTVYKIFGLDSYRLLLSTRPDNYIGELEDWEIAENELKSVLESTGREWSINEGDGAFYGPKIDVLLKDQFKKEHQVATIQLDFQLPQRFKLQYKAEESGKFERPIMIHRAVFGSLERFFAILLDQYQGHWPFWLSPRQAVILPVNETHIDHCRKVQKALVGDLVDDDLGSPSPMTGFNFSVDIDKRNTTIGARIKESIKKGYTYIVMVGDKEVENNNISIRHRQHRKAESMTTEEAFKYFMELEKAYK